MCVAAGDGVAVATNVGVAFGVCVAVTGVGVAIGVPAGETVSGGAGDAVDMAARCAETSRVHRPTELPA